MLAVTTLGVAIAAQQWLLGQPWLMGEGVQPGRPIFRGFAFDTGKRYYYLALVLMRLVQSYLGDLTALARSGLAVPDDGAIAART